ncbi:hypothetical protein E1162_05645 [Rhodobacteraceae bacterium RKSG542]|uniref:hypothetical protein n=1 Tax=Pseudovibrio flavus TaxID=2529854 RepID=UPI0012BC9CDC|nr:hypothetical protein [Pseudovibrio flavus]MTI16717.1 hypothetical protein [Pseudovibrio flavus]
MPSLKAKSDPTRYAELIELEERLDERIRKMQKLLSSAKPKSGSEALSLLRKAFPKSSLQDRIKAMDLPKHHSAPR